MADLAEIKDLIEQLEAPIDWAHFVRDDHAMDYQEFHMRVGNAFHELLQEWKWRPIKLWPEGLETVRKAHLVWCPSNLCMYTATRRKDGWFESFGGAGKIYQGVSHYMPLPSEEKENGVE